MHDEIEVIDQFAKLAHVNKKPSYRIDEKAGETILGIYVAQITKKFAKYARTINEQLEPNNKFKDKVILLEAKPKSWLDSIECQVFKNSIEQSLTVGENNILSDTFVPFVGGTEFTILNKNNHVVYGRRGAGKSSLILHACKMAIQDKKPYAWIAMQQFTKRNDPHVITQLLYSLIDSLTKHDYDKRKTRKMIAILDKLERKDNLSVDEIMQEVPSLSRDFKAFAQSHEAFYIFLDDLHVIHPDLQPQLLFVLYALSRGNSIFLKITAIENLSKLYDVYTKTGLQAPHDVQTIKLDYNLTDPKKAFDHIVSILDEYAKAAGLININNLSSKDALERLLWVSAGVPRDALYIYNNAISEAISAGRKSVSVTDVNMAASKSLQEKERLLEEDLSDNKNGITKVLDDIKRFCIQEIHSNGFLVLKDNTKEAYRLIKEINDLRYIHIIHEGITPRSVGEIYEAYLLDYAFYTGLRRTRKVEEYAQEINKPLAKDIRKLNIYKYSRIT